MLRLIFSDETISPPLTEPFMLGRTIIDDPFVSKQQALLEPLVSSPPSILLTVKGKNSIIVETRLEGSYVVKGLLEKQGHACMELVEGDRFFVSGRKETTAVQVIMGLGLGSSPRSCFLVWGGYLEVAGGLT